MVNPPGDAAPPADGGLRLTGARVRFGELTAVDGVDLLVRPGEITALVGPSGCGKSTLLRFVAGLEPGEGAVAWGDTDLTRTRPDRRRFGLMFQDHALFTDRPVGDNIAFGLRMVGADAARRRRRVTEMLDLVGLAGYEDRAIDTLSGGEAQRVALARSLAPEPRLLMLDEPLGSLDRVLRERLALDLRRILTSAGVAAVLVTHDQEEAYAVADHLAVMRAGRIVRRGPAAEVWADPASVFTARFLGHRNVLDRAALDALGIDLVPPEGADRSMGGVVGDPLPSGDGAAVGAETAGSVSDQSVTHVVIPEASLRILPHGPGDPDDADGPASVRDPGAPDGPGGTSPGRGPAGSRVVEARVAAVRFRGPISQVDLEVATGARPIELRLHPARPPQRGASVRLVIDPAGIRPLIGEDPADPGSPRQPES